MTERKHLGKDAKFWEQAAGRNHTAPILRAASGEKRPWVSTSHLHITAPGIERMTLTHLSVYRLAPHLDDVRHILHLTHGSTAGLKIETQRGLRELLIFYFNALPDRPATIVLKTGKKIQTSRERGVNKHFMLGGLKATLSPYFDDEVELGGLKIRSNTEIL